jgi:hypothetical protein
MFGMYETRVLEETSIGASVLLLLYTTNLPLVYHAPHCICYFKNMSKLFSIVWKI